MQVITMKIIVPLCLILLGMFEKVVSEYPAYEDTPEVMQEANDTYELPGTTIIDCECAVFNTAFPKSTDKPILVQVPHYVDCILDGEEHCIALCSTLAKAAKKHGPEVICSIVGHYTFLIASIHSRVLCTPSNNWIYTGLTSSDEICCEEHRVIDCKELINKNVHPNNA